MRLPEFWQFLEPGWWMIHLLGTAIIYMLGMGHGRRQALREQARREEESRRRTPEAPR